MSGSEGESPEQVAADEAVATDRLAEETALSVDREPDDPERGEWSKTGTLDEEQLAAAQSSLTGDATEAAEAAGIAPRAIDQHGDKAYGTESTRALRAFDAIPGDSQHEVDYKTGSVGTTDLSAANYGYEVAPELTVELVVTTPDGRRFSFGEGEELDEADHERISEMIHQVAGSALHRFRATNQRLVLGL